MAFGVISEFMKDKLFHIVQRYGEWYLFNWRNQRAYIGKPPNG